MGAELYRIAAHEDAELDTSRIVVLRQSLGDERCREVVEEVVFHLTDRLGKLRVALDAGNTAEGAGAGRRGSRASASRSASPTSPASRATSAPASPRTTATATGAVAARLRLGEDSLFSVMIYADQSAL